MKKSLKIIFCNLLVFIVLVIIAEVICYICAVKYQQFFIPHIASQYVWERYFVTPTYQYYDVPGTRLRPVAGKEYNKKPILLFGCSVTYGNLLNDDENFSGQLSKMTKRPVYNLANDGWSFAHMLKQLQSNKEIENLDPEYIIYTYIHDQRRRMYFFQGWYHDTELYLRYIPDKNGKLKLVPKKYPFWYRLLIVKYIQYAIQRTMINNAESSSNLMLKILKESTDIIKSRYPKAKLIFLLYEDEDCSTPEGREIKDVNAFLNDKEQHELEKMGFKIYSMDELGNNLYCLPDYRLDDGHHPNAKMWQDFLPSLVKELKL